MPHHASRSRVALALAVLVTSALGCEAPGRAAPEDVWTDLSATETALGVTCVGTEACSGTGDVYTSSLRVGASATSRGELVQSFVATLDGRPGAIALLVRPLRTFTSTTPPRLRVAIYDPPDANAPELDNLSALLEGSVAVASLARGAPTRIPLTGTGTLVSGHAYVLHVWSDAADGDGSVLLGIGSLVDPTYGSGAALRRVSRRAAGGDPWADARPRPIGGDIAFAFSGVAGSACAAPSECRSGLVCYANACVTPNATPLAISPAAPTVYANSTTTFSASGGDAPYAFSLVSGGGSLSGATWTAPAAAGSATVRVTDLYGFTSDAAITIVPDTRTTACTGLAANASWNTASEITQTWNGSGWAPSEAGVHDPVASTTECRFACNGGYTWNGTICQQNTIEIVSDGAGGRRWADGTFALSCNGYRNPTAPWAYAGLTGDGTYTIDPDGNGPGTTLQVTCDMTGGGWTVFTTAIPYARGRECTTGSNITATGPISLQAVYNSTAWGSGTHAGCGWWSTIRLHFTEIRVTNLSGVAITCANVPFADPRLTVFRNPAITPTDFHYPGWNPECSGGNCDVAFTKRVGTGLTNAIYAVGEGDYYVHFGVGTYSGCNSTGGATLAVR